MQAILTDFHPVSALPEGSGPERRSEGLRTPLRNSGASSEPRHAPSFREGPRRLARNVTTFTLEMPASICIGPSNGVQ
nr:MAG TPA: hypothetical protein [Caudoviricetes sp.]